MSVDSDRDLEGLKAAGRVVADALRMLRAATCAGVTTGELDGIAADLFRRRGARSGPRLDYAYPGAVCISVNEEAVHGIPGDRALEPGDLVTLDVTAELDGYYADAAVTVIVPPASPVALALASCAESAFWHGLERVRAGTPLRTVGAAVEREVSRRGFRVLRDLSGHGIGRRIHEEPRVPNYGDPAATERLADGLVITLEPIVSVGAREARLLPDGWTVVSADGSLTAHFEHTLVVRRDRPLLLTAA